MFGDDYKQTSMYELKFYTNIHNLKELFRVWYIIFIIVSLPFLFMIGAASNVTNISRSIVYVLSFSSVVGIATIIALFFINHPSKYVRIGFYVVLLFIPLGMLVF